MTLLAIDITPASESQCSSFASGTEVHFCYVEAQSSTQNREQGGFTELRSVNLLVQHTPTQQSEHQEAIVTFKANKFVKVLGNES